MHIKRRVLNETAYQLLLSEGVPSFVANVIARRPLPEHAKGALGVIAPKLADLDPPFLMKDMDKAVTRLRQAILQGEMIAIETDHDCDGQTSHAVMMLALRAFGVAEARLQSYIGHRMQEGYGLSEALLARILANPVRPQLVITADNGSSDEPRIALLKAAGIDVIVTDHHAIPLEGVPKSALACLNPTREDCAYPDPYIAGCMVAWLFMAATRRTMIDAGELPDTTLAMTELLDFVAVGTVADCVSLARSLNNRIVVHYGLGRINRFDRICWQALRPLLYQERVSSEDLGFVVAPLLNSDGRLSDALGGVNFLLTESESEAKIMVQALWQQNQARKEIQKKLMVDALQMATHEVASGKAAIVVYLKDGHAGVHGIAASRLKDQFGKPTIIFSPKLNEEGMITGSARSVDGVNIKDALQAVHLAHPQLLKRFGGHKMAAGMSILHADFECFKEAFDAAVLAQVERDTLVPMLFSDGTLEEVSLPGYEALMRLEPFGREFDTPCFEFEGTLQSVRAVGDEAQHLQFVLKQDNGAMLSAVYFNVPETLKLQPGEQVFVIASLQANTYRGKCELKLRAVYVSPAPDIRKA